MAIIDFNPNAEGQMDRACTPRELRTNTTAYGHKIVAMPRFGHRRNALLFSCTWTVGFRIYEQFRLTDYQYMMLSLKKGEPVPHFRSNAIGKYPWLLNSLLDSQRRAPVYS